MGSAQPQLWIIAGPNGSGKTTIAKDKGLYDRSDISVINPDEIAEQISPGDVSKASMEAGREAIKLQNVALKEGKNFAIETTFSGNREFKLIEKAKAKNFKVNLVYIGLKKSVTNIHRVKARVAQGGHHIPTKDITRRYKRSMENLTKAFDKVDRLFVLDNSGKKHSLCLVKENNKLRNISKNIPEWLDKVLPEKERVLIDIEKYKRKANFLKVGKQSELVKKMGYKALSAETKKLKESIVKAGFSAEQQKQLLGQIGKIQAQAQQLIKGQGLGR